MLNTERFSINLGVSAGIFFLDEIGIVDKAADRRLIKYSALPRPSLKLLSSLDYYFIYLKEKNIKIGFTILGGLNYAKVPRGNVVNEDKQLIKDFPEIDFSGYQLCGGLKVRF